MSRSALEVRIDARADALEGMARAEFLDELSAADLLKLKPYIRDIARMGMALRSLDLNDSDPRSMSYEADAPYPGEGTDRSS